MLKSLSNLTLAQVYPEIPGETDLNCCGNPDCGNYGVPPETVKHLFKGPNAGQRRMAAAIADPTIGGGLGRYKMETEDREELKRETDAFEFSGDPVGWNDGRVVTCQHARGNTECGVQFSLLSNQHFEEELDRLLTQKGCYWGRAVATAENATSRHLRSSFSTAQTESRGNATAPKGQLPEPSG